MVSPNQYDAQEGTPREVHLRDYWKILWQGRLKIAAVFIVVVGFAGFHAFMQTPIYETTATIEVQPKGTRMAAGQDLSGMGAGVGWFAEEKYHNTQVEIIKSRDVAQRVIERLDVTNISRFEEVEDPADALRMSLQVIPRRETGLIEISLLGADPHEIVEIVNAVADAYVERNIEKAEDRMEEAFGTIKQQLLVFEAQYEAAEEERIESLSTEAGGMSIISVEVQKSVIEEKLRALNEELNRVDLESLGLQKTLDQVRSMPSRGADLTNIPELAEDLTLAGLMEQRGKIERDLEGAKVDLKPNHPDVDRLETQLDSIDQRIGDRRMVILGSIQTRFEMFQDRERSLRKRIRDEEAFSLEVVKNSSEYAKKKSKADIKERVLQTIDKALNEVQLGSQFLTNNVAVLDHAKIPQWPVKPRKKVIVAIGALLGLLMGVGVAFFVDYLDNTFRDPEDLEKYLGLAVLAVVPKMRDGSDDDRGLREAYQSLRTSVIFSSLNRQRKVILITSTAPQEGKSSTIANLARVLASSGERVAVLDCDLRRPTQHKHLKIERGRGLTNFLTAPIEERDWKIYGQRVDSTTVDAYAAGPIPPSPPELLSGDRFKTMVSEMRREYDWVLIDSPPAASLADATTLAGVADMLVLVVKHNATDRDLVYKSLQRLRSFNEHVVGAVLNNVDLERTYNRDYYYAGYYYEDREDDKTGKTKKKLRVDKSRVG